MGGGGRCLSLQDWSYTIPSDSVTFYFVNMGIGDIAQCLLHLGEFVSHY